ncbi:MAG: DUF4271 domain-containing protein [Flavobacteriaceae bacterium]|nr:DUF4271 domain-containing protein [Flavobacteriaceae bacterium]
MNWIERSLPTQNWITIVLFVCLFLLAMAKIINDKKFKDYLILPINNRYFLLYEKGAKLFSGFHLVNTLFQFFCTTLFLWIGGDHFGILPEGNTILHFFYIMLGIFVFMMLKWLLQKLIGNLFDIDHLVHNYVYHKWSYFNYSAIFLLIANTMLVYSFSSVEPAIYIIGFFFLLINFVGWITTIKTYQKAISINIFYFILYLCALEISPYIIVGHYFKYW